MSIENINKQTFTEDLGELLESVGERLGTELYHVISPVLRSASSFRSRFISGFKRGWNKARESQQETDEFGPVDLTHVEPDKLR